MSFSDFNVTRLISAISGVAVLLLCVSLPVLGQPVENGDIIVLFADFEGPDPVGIPVTETLYSWIQQVGAEDGTFRVIRMGEPIGPLDSFEAAFERGLDEGADLVIYGVYDLPGTHVRLVVAIAACSGSQYGTVMQIPFDLTGTFPISELVPGSDPPERIRALSYFLACFTYLSRGDFEQGLEYFNKALEYEDSAPVEMIAATYSLRSFINLQWRNDALTALADANRAIDMDPENPIHYTYRGACYESMGELEDALEDYLTVKELDPSDPENLYNLSRLYQDLGYYDMAIDAINVAILLVPGDECYLNTRGCVYNYMGEYQAAADDISGALELNPDYPTGWANLACAERELGNLTEAIRCFSNAIEYQTDIALISSYMRNRGICYERLEDLDSAISNYTSSLELCPGTSANYYHLGWLLAQVEDYENALGYYDRALQMDGDNPAYLRGRGLCNYEILNTAEAIIDLATALEIDPDGFTTYNYEVLGKAYAEEDDFVSAIVCLSGGIDKASEPSEKSWLLSYRARCSRLAGDLESSMVDLTEATQLLPTEAFFHFKLGEVYYLMNRDEEAIESHSAAIERGLSSDYISGCLFQRGRSYLILNVYDQAVQDLTATLEHDPRYYDAYFFRGLAHYYNGELDMCREDMENFLQVGTDPVFTADARKILELLE